MWRKTFALVSAVILMATMAATAVADSHLPAATSGGGGAVTAPPVTAVPSTGVGLMPDQIPSVLLLGLIGLAALFALLALTTMSREQRA